MFSSIDTVGAYVSDFSRSSAAGFTVNVDFGNGTLNGTSTGGTLSVAGTISGNDVTGTSTLLGLPGTFEGKVGSTGAVGAFHGGGTSSQTTGNNVYAGGFYAD